jgi:hypothetical protein
LATAAAVDPLLQLADARFEKLFARDETMWRAARWRDDHRLGFLSGVNCRQQQRQTFPFARRRRKEKQCAATFGAQALVEHRAFVRQPEKIVEADVEPGAGLVTQPDLTAQRREARRIRDAVVGAEQGIAAVFERAIPGVGRTADRAVRAGLDAVEFRKGLLDERHDLIGLAQCGRVFGPGEGGVGHGQVVSGPAPGTRARPGHLIGAGLLRADARRGAGERRDPQRAQNTSAPPHWLPPQVPVRGTMKIE